VPRELRLTFVCVVVVVVQLCPGATAVFVGGVLSVRFQSQ
jgi:hypothetical protein